MLRKRDFLLLPALVLLATPPALAQTVPEALAQRLAEEGFEIVETGRTWLGRTLIKARKEGQEREIVLERGSGQILHDRQRSADLPDTPAPSEPGPKPEKPDRPAKPGPEDKGGKQNGGDRK